MRISNRLLAGAAPLALAILPAAPAMAGAGVACVSGQTAGPDGVLGTLDDENVATLECGERSGTFGSSSVALGYDAHTVGENSAAVGALTVANGARATAIGYASQAAGDDSTAIGARALANVDGNTISVASRPDDLAPTVVGGTARASGVNDAAFGAFSLVGAAYYDFGVVNNGTAIGAGAAVTANDGTALGYNSQVTASNAVAIGSQSVADQANTVSVGSVGAERRIVNVAAGTAATDAVNRAQLDAVSNAAGHAQQTADLARTEAGAALAAAQDGTNAASALATAAQGTANTALANAATAQSTADQARVEAATAQGTADQARGEAATAQGTADHALANTTYFVANADGAVPVATGANSVAIGPGATATRDGQVAIGGASSTYTMAGLSSDASQAAQEGAVRLVTTDMAGNLATADINVAELNGYGQRIGTLEGQVSALKGAVGRGFRRADGGIAAAMALGGTVMPADMHLAVSFNLATYRGQQGFSGAVVARVSDHMWVSGGFAGSTVHGSNGGRAGMTFGW